MKTNFFKFRLAIFAIAALTVFVSCSKDEDDKQAESKNIAQVASSNPDFSILVEALAKADLVSALEGTGPFTVFAPTNAAFNSLFAQLGVSGISELSAETLKPILLNHVISGNVKAMDIATGYVETLNNYGPNGNKVKLFIQKGSNVMVDGSKVVTTDVIASNGTIHAIDKVILPASVVSHAINNPDFSILVQAVVKPDWLML
ncbi:MAG: fasciclin domain-containing protein [Bacteroidales bacterium]|nr:fasciclin domain-containing protein [Bacteroidales bacterium]